MGVSDLVVAKFEETLLILLQDKPIDKITVDEIVSNSGFSKRTFYNHFRDKNDLVSSIWRREYRNSWFDDNGEPLTFREFLVKYHSREIELLKFLRNTLPYSGQNNLWETVQEFTVFNLVDFIERCGYGDRIDGDLMASIEFFTHGVNGLAQTEFRHMSMHSAQYTAKTPEEKADEEIGFLPERLRPYLLLDPKCPCLPEGM